MENVLDQDSRFGSKSQMTSLKQGFGVKISLDGIHRFCGKVEEISQNGFAEQFHGLYSSFDYFSYLQGLHKLNIDFYYI